MKWVYTAIIRPALLFGAVSWLPAFSKLNCLGKLQGVQRTALRLISGTAKSTPAFALECLLGVLPINIYAQGLALSTMHRLRYNNSWKGVTLRGNLKRPTHTGMCEELGRQIPALSFPCDFNRNRELKALNFEIITPSYDDWLTRGEPECTLEEVHCYTDGSRHDDLSGCAFTVFFNGECWQEIIPLGEHPTVFQAEVVALNCAAINLALALEDRVNINIYSDSLSALEALKSFKHKTDLINECLDNLNVLGARHNLKLTWIPAHKGFHGNEEADSLAKEAASIAPIGPEPIIPISVNVVSQSIREWSSRQLDRAHKNYRGGRVFKELAPQPSEIKTRGLIGMVRPTLRDLVSILTGHSVLQSHQFRIGNAETDMCQQCQNLQRETSLHFLAECDRYAQLRFNIFGSHLLGAEDIRVATPTNISKFIELSGRLCLGRMGSSQASQ